MISCHVLGELMTIKRLVVLCLLLSFSLIQLFLVEAQTQQTYVLPLQGPTWDHSSLSILVIPRYDQSWWNTGYLNSTLRAISQWNDAISYFAANHSEFAYLSRLRMTTEVSNVTVGGFDIYVSWIGQFGNETCDAGLTKTAYTSSNVITNSTVALSALDCLGNVLNEVDMQNVALHELGHSLGLGHSNYTGDTMYPVYTLLSPPRLISTLDVYGIALVFAWLDNSFSFYPVNDWLTASSAALPSSVAYENLPVSPQNVTPQTLSDNPVIQALTLLFELLLHRDILIVIVLLIAVFLVISLFPRRKRVAKAHS